MSPVTRHSPLLFGLDAIPLTEPKTGVGHYTFELARALAVLSPSAEFELAYPSVYPPLTLEEETGLPLPRNLRAARVHVGVVARHWWSVGLPAYVRRRGLQLFHGTNFDVPLWNRCPTVLTIHDLSLLLHPETHEARRVRRARRRLPLMVRQATMIITPSESVRRELCERLRVSPEKVAAVPEAPRRIFRPLPSETTLDVRRRLGLGEDKFLLSVGTIEPRKNLLTLVRAFEEALRLDPALAPLRLVMAGGDGWLNRELRAYVDSSSRREQIHFTGYIPDADLRALYSSCAAFVYPSLYEGFGLPPLEAMACGAPVITSRIPSLAETLAEAALLFHPADVQALARHLRELCNNDELRLNLSSAGQLRAAEFTWERTARLTLDVYEEALKRATKAKPTP